MVARSPVGTQAGAPAFCNRRGPGRACV